MDYQSKQPLHQEQQQHQQHQQHHQQQYQHSPYSSDQQHYREQLPYSDQQRDVPKHEAIHTGHGDEFQSGLCSCGPCGTCMLSCCLPCMQIGRTATRMKDPSMNSHNEMNSDCLIFCGIHSLTGLGFIYNMIKRGEIREQFGIKGSGCGDCCVSYWCLCCAMIQQDNEVKLRTQGLVTKGYQPQAGMRVP